MAEIHHLEYGWVTPAVSYTLSVLGSLLGLICAVRLRNAPTTGGRVWWLTLAAVAIGGTGIWTMHFVAMMGFSVVGSPIRYDVSLTAASAILAVVTVGVGLAIALLGSGGARLFRIVIGGVLAGLGVAAMHYTGMAAMRLNGHIDYGTPRVAISVAIAVVAATVALWLAVTVRKTVAIVASALIMGIAVNGMHFTGMSAMSVQTEPAVVPLSGATAAALLIPIGVAVLFGVLGLAYALMAAPTDEDRAGLAYIAARQGESVPPPAAATRPAPAAARPAPAAPRPAPPPAPATPPPADPEADWRPGLGAQLSSLEPEPDEGDEPTRRLPTGEARPQVPNQRLPRRTPSVSSSWIFRDRADQ
jgi:NO-binding membrane sensor protein with MHYT domain